MGMKTGSHHSTPVYQCHHPPLPQPGLLVGVGKFPPHTRLASKAGWREGAVPGPGPSLGSPSCPTPPQKTESRARGSRASLALCSCSYQESARASCIHTPLTLTSASGLLPAILGEKGGGEGGAAAGQQFSHTP